MAVAIETLKPWQVAWREHVAPHLSTRGLEALAVALRDNDPRLIQGNVTHPDEWGVEKEKAISSACAIGFCRWQGEALTNTRQVWDAFYEISEQSMDVDNFIEWYDNTPRDEMRASLLPEVLRELEK